MNKKLSSLVAGVLLATSFSASALSDGSPLTTKNVKFENGQSYYLTTDSTYLGDVLVINSDNKLEFVARGSFDAYTKANRAYGYWTISQEASPSGDYVYKFLNKGTGEYLSIPDSATTVLSANAENGISNFLWDLKGEPSANDSYAGAPLKSFLKDGSSIEICNVLEVNQDNVGGDLGSNKATTYRESYTCSWATAGIRILKKTTLTADSIYLNGSLSQISDFGKVTAVQISELKEKVARIEAALKKFGINRDTIALAKYKVLADVVIAAKVPTGEATVELSITNDTGNDASVDISSILKASPYGYAAKVNGKWQGVFYVKKATDNIIEGKGERLAKGLLFVSGPDTDKPEQGMVAIPAGPVTLQPALYRPAEFKDRKSVV